MPEGVRLPVGTLSQAPVEGLGQDSDMAKIPGCRSMPQDMPVSYQDHATIVELQVGRFKSNHHDLVLKLLLRFLHVVHNEDVGGEPLHVGDGGPEAALVRLRQLVDDHIPCSTLVDPLDIALFDKKAPVIV